MIAEDFKIVAVGDRYVGKTCLLCTFAWRGFPKQPSLDCEFSRMLKIDEKHYNIVLYDTNGEEEYDRLRPLCYPQTSCFFLCFSIANRNSFENIKTKWYPEVRKYMRKTPIILVATKTDFREDSENESLVTTARGEQMKEEIQAVKYFECSAKSEQGIDEIIEETVKIVENIKRTKRKKYMKCILL